MIEYNEFFDLLEKRGFVSRQKGCYCYGDEKIICDYWSNHPYKKWYYGIWNNDRMEYILYDIGDKLNDLELTIQDYIIHNLELFV